jgi:signal transduction histidine kinase
MSDAHFRRRNFAAYLPSAVAAAALLVFSFAFISEFRSFRDSVVARANADLGTRSVLAADSLAEPLKTDDFRRIRDFGEFCNRDGMRLLVTGRARGGKVYDSAPGRAGAEMLWRSSDCGAYRVSVGLPVSEVMKPFRRAVAGFVLAALVAAAGVMLFFLVTYRQRVRIRELSELERFRREFISDISHEIKTPLTGIIGAVDLLSDFETLSADERGALLSMVRRESGRVNELAESVLALARLEREGAEKAVHREKAELPELVKRCTERFAGRAAECGCEMVLSLPPGDRQVECDIALTERALDNLLANALAHSGSKKVIIALKWVRGGAEISVEDFGCGIDSAHHGRIFERFYRVDRSRGGSGGSGLGLAIAKNAVELQGGGIRLESKETSGVRFVLTLPVR